MFDELADNQFLKQQEVHWGDQGRPVSRLILMNPQKQRLSMMTQQSAEPTALNQEWFQQEQDDAALQYYWWVEEINCRIRPFAVLLLSGHWLINQQRHDCAVQPDLSACQEAATAHLTLAEEVQSEGQRALWGCECLVHLIQDLYKHFARPELEEYLLDHWCAWQMCNKLAATSWLNCSEVIYIFSC